MSRTVIFALGACELKLEEGDITACQAQAIVNAANSSLLGGGGVDGAIHRAGGAAILEECRRIVARQGPLPAGQAVITTGGRLPAKHVIHTVGPVWRGGGAGEPGLLASCYTACLELAVENRLGSVAFPSISTGAFGYPVTAAAPVALRAVAEFLKVHRAPGRVAFVLFDGRTFRAYREALGGLAVRS